VLQHVARGYTYRETGVPCSSREAVETQVVSVLRKLQLTNRNELTRWAADRQLI
jgi:DNA-binding NarL/FixJ family response regulator